MRHIENAIKNAATNAATKATAKYNAAQRIAWGNARFRILLLSALSYVALC